MLKANPMDQLLTDEGDCHGYNPLIILIFDITHALHAHWLNQAARFCNYSLRSLPPTLYSVRITYTCINLPVTLFNFCQFGDSCLCRWTESLSLMQTSLGQRQL